MGLNSPIRRCAASPETSTFGDDLHKFNKVFLLQNKRIFSPFSLQKNFLDLICLARFFFSLKNEVQILCSVCSDLRKHQKEWHQMTKKSFTFGNWCARKSANLKTHWSKNDSTVNKLTSLMSNHQINSHHQTAPCELTFSSIRWSSLYFSNEARS